MKPDLSLIIPAYNERNRLPHTLQEVSAALSRLGGDAEIIVVDDGSQDDTVAIAESTECDVPKKVLRLDRNRGKGAAISLGVREARHAIVAFTDADCPYDLSALAPMIAAVEAGKIDIGIGARDLPESEVNRGYGPLRFVAGKVFSLLTYLAIDMPFRDSQCGLKLFRRDVAQQLFALRTIDGFGFDIETLAAAIAQGHRVGTFPVRLTHNDDSRINLVSDSLEMAADVLRVRRNLRRGAYEKLSLVTHTHPCPLCGADEFLPRAANHGFRMVECLECSLWYLAPMPTTESIATLYGSEYYDNDSPLQAGYAEYDEMREEYVATFARRLRLVEHQVGSGRILDVGAGFGYLLDAAREKFSERWALELSETAAARIAPDHRAVVGTLDSPELPHSHFDVVSMQDCFEHVPNPRETLEQVRRVLRPGGIFLATTPDVGSWLRRLQGRNWVSLKFPEHVVLYSEATLRRALAEAGFRVQSIEPASQYVKPAFVASRLFPEHPSLASALAKTAEFLGGAKKQIYVPSGSLTIAATPDG